MPYIGKQPEIGAYKKLDSITAVNGQAAYTLQYNSANYNAASANHLIVSLNGVIQAPQDSFSVSGSTLTFASNLSTGDSVDFVLALGDVLSVGVPSDNTITNDKLATAPTIISKGDGGSTDGAIQLNCSQNSHGVKIKSPPHSAGQSYTLTLPSTAPSNGLGLVTDGSGNLSFSSSFYSSMLHVTEEAAYNTAGTTANSAGNYLKLGLNTVKRNAITSATLSSSVISLPAGTYYCEGHVTAYDTNYTQTRLRDTTNSTTVVLGSGVRVGSNETENTPIRGSFTLSGTANLEFQAISSGTSTNGFGYPSTTGDSSEGSVYSQLMIIKVG